MRKVNLTSVLDPNGQFRRLLGIEPEDLYNLRLSTGCTLGLRQDLHLLQALISASHAILVQRLVRHWQATRPDMVVSLIPNFNRALHDGLQAALPRTPFVTVMTDLADHQPAFWAEPCTQQHLVCGTTHACQQALAAGLPPAQVHAVRGMLLRPAFYQPATSDRTSDRAAAVLDMASPTGLVLFGGAGSRVMRRIAQALPRVPLILLCGTNDALAASVRSMPAGAPRVVLGHTQDVARHMRMADFFIGKPGPGSLSEAVHLGLPVVVTRNSWTLPQERWNAEWVLQNNVGVVHRSFATVQSAVDEVVRRLPELRANTSRVPNTAAVEVPALLQRMLQDRGAGMHVEQGARGALLQ